MSERTVSLDYVRASLRLQGVPVPEDELENVRLRLELWLRALDEVEAAIGREMDEVDPIPPIYPQEDF